MGGSNANLLEDIRTSKKNLTLSSEAITTAHAAFTIHYNSFLILAEKLEGEFKELEVREGAVDKREKDVKAQEDQLQEREQKCTEREHKVVVREGAVTTKEERWTATEKKMQENTNKLPSVIQFNVCMCNLFLDHKLPSTTPPLAPSPSILSSSFSSFSTGGARFTVSKDKLLQTQGSLFQQMITSNHSQQLPSGEYVNLIILTLLSHTFPLHSLHAILSPFFSNASSLNHLIQNIH